MINEITQLSDNVIGHILGFMPLPDAVRTSVLSREWRYKHKDLSKIAIYKVDVKEKLLSGIIGMLRAHNSPILEFILAVEELDPCAEIDEILKLVCKKGRLQEIILMIMTEKRAVLDSSLFSCQALSFLLLESCVLKPPPEFTGFTKLVNLTLISVDITAQLLSTLISQSPLLQGLCLAICPFDGPVQLTAPKLNFFHFSISETRISVAAPRLLEACLTLPFARTQFKQESTHHIKQDVLQLKSVDTIVSLHLDHHYMKSLLRGGSRPKFEHLRVLKLSKICFGITHEVKCILELIKSSGSLEKIIIQVLYLAPAEQEDGDDVMFGEELDLSCSRIREVQMLDMSGSKTELAFVETMLLKLTQLETMIIALDLENVGSGGGGENEKLVYQFRRTSPLATIVFRDSHACKKSLACEYCKFLAGKIQFRI